MGNHLILERNINYTPSEQTYQVSGLIPPNYYINPIDKIFPWKIPRKQ